MECRVRRAGCGIPHSVVRIYDSIRLHSYYYPEKFAQGSQILSYSHSYSYSHSLIGLRPKAALGSFVVLLLFLSFALLTVPTSAPILKTWYESRAELS